MPFESKNSGRSNRRRENSFLSPELEALGDQLEQDSQWLALSYPARKPQLPLRQPRRFKWVAVGAVVALVLVAIDGVWLWTRPAAPSTSPEKFVSVPAVSPAPVRPRNPMPTVTPAAVETRAPAALFKDLNGAEKEAVLDFLEERGQTLPKTSLPL